MTQKDSPLPQRIVGVIPARLASSRLPGKVLRDLNGQPLLAWVYRAARACTQFDEIVIAADSTEVEALCAARNWPCLMTSPNLPSGTDRLYAVSRILHADIYVNIQGDEHIVQDDAVIGVLGDEVEVEVFHSGRL